MAEEKTLNQLWDDIAVAKIKGKEAEDANRDDGGSCNLDYCRVYFGKDIYNVYPNTYRQANGRYRNVKAIVAYLSEKGWNAEHMYIMD